MDSLFSGTIVSGKNIHLDIWKLSLGNASNQDTFIQRNLLSLTEDSENLCHLYHNPAQHDRSSSHSRWHPRRRGSLSPLLPVKEYSIWPEQGGQHFPSALPPARLCVAEDLFQKQPLRGLVWGSQALPKPH